MFLNSCVTGVITITFCLLRVISSVCKYFHAFSALSRALHWVLWKGPWAASRALLQEDLSFQWKRALSTLMAHCSEARLASMGRNKAFLQWVAVAQKVDARLSRKVSVHSESKGRKAFPRAEEALRMRPRHLTYSGKRSMSLYAGRKALVLVPEN